MDLDLEAWQPARLIPTSGINGQEEAERRATSALLAVMQAVLEFRVAILKPLGAPAGVLGSYIEVPFTIPDDRTVIPDGLLHVTRGKTSWVALVEVKTGSGELYREQVENYIDVARENGFDAVLTVSNQLAPAPGVHPVEVDKRKLKKTALFHLSWAEVLTHAVQIRVHHGVSDPDQAWILGELIRYLEHPKSGALDFADMGADWVPVREAVNAGTLRANDKGVAEVASRWDQLLRFAALRLGRELGADVQVVVPRKEVTEPSLRLSRHIADLTATGTLSGQLRVPDAVGTIDVCADLRAGQVTVSTEVDAPQEGRLPTRVGWLTRQLKDAPDQLRIDGLLSGTRTTTSELLSVVRGDPSVLVDPSKREFRGFRVTAISPMGTKRGTGRAAFIDSVLSAVDGFYGGVLQALRPWAAKAPQLPKAGKLATEEAGIDTTPPSTDLAEEPEPGLLTPPADDDVPELPEPEPDRLRIVPATPETASPEQELVSWDAASERLDRERAHDIASS